MNALEINIGRLTEIHSGIEAARNHLAEITPPSIQCQSHSIAMPLFQEQVKALHQVVSLYVEKLGKDSQALFQAASLYLEADSDLAREYQRRIGQRFH